MDLRITTAVLGAVATASSTVAFVPQIAKIWKTGGKDVSISMLSLYVVGVTLWFFYGLAIGATALSMANAASIVFAGTCLALKFMKGRHAVKGNQKRRFRIAIDMDGTIADSAKEHIRRYNEEFADTVTVDDLSSKHLEDHAPVERREAVRRMVRDESFFDRLDLIDGAQQVIQELVREHEIFIVSAAMEIPVSFAAKHRWLRRHFPFIPERNIVFCGNKGIVNADYLIDDEARHFRDFGGIGILFSSHHNLAETWYKRVATWHDVRREFLTPAGSESCDEGERTVQLSIQPGVTIAGRWNS